jgi:phosphate-selective porin OprO/OprP
LVHLGLSGSYIDPRDDIPLRFRSRPEAHLAPRFVDTGAATFAGADHAQLMGTEAAVVCGPFSVQAEYLRSWVTSALGASSFDGFYVFGSWFITGEHRNYKRSSGTFDRLTPHKSFSLTDGGPGAWEVAVRYSQSALNDEGVTGGRLNDITVGVNWYLNPNAKIQINYVNAMVDRTSAGVNHDGSAHVVQGRFAVDF